MNVPIAYMLKLCSAPKAMIQPHRRHPSRHRATTANGRRSTLASCLTVRAAATGSQDEAARRRPIEPGHPSDEKRRPPAVLLRDPPLTKKLIASPSGRPSMKIDIARARRSAGTRSPISELAVGAQVASPTPTPSRKTNSDQKPHAKPETKVMSAPEHHARREQPPAVPAVGQPAERQPTTA